MSYRVGLTGGIGSGKSTVAKLLAELDVPVIDTDTISHQLTQIGGAAITGIRSAFGESYINTDNSLDRTKMRQLVFSDMAAKQTLENILHPLIFAQTQSQADAYTAPYVLIVIPLLFETGNYQSWLNRTLTVDCAEENQILRASKRKGMNEQSVRTIMKQQLSRLQRNKLADEVINNDSDMADLQTRVNSLNLRLLNLSKGSN